MRRSVGTCRKPRCRAATACPRAPVFGVLMGLTAMGAGAPVERDPFQPPRRGRGSRCAGNPGLPSRDPCPKRQGSNATRINAAAARRDSDPPRLGPIGQAANRRRRRETTLYSMAPAQRSPAAGGSPSDDTWFSSASRPARLRVSAPLRPGGTIPAGARRPANAGAAQTGGTGRARRSAKDRRRCQNGVRAALTPSGLPSGQGRGRAALLCFLHIRAPAPVQKAFPGENSRRSTRSPITTMTIMMPITCSMAFNSRP